MEILRVAADLYPEVVGGYGLHIHEMSKVQAQMGHDVTVFTKKIDDEPNFEERHGYKIQRFEPNAEIFGNSITLNMVNDLHYKFDDYDVIHAHSHLFFPTNLSALLNRFKDTPLVITNHGLESQTPPLWVSKLYNETLGKWTFNSADVIISYSEEEKEKMRDLGITTDIEIIHNGINTDKFKPLNDVEKKNQILWVGRFLPGKGVRYLIEAFSLLKKEHDDLTLKLVGEGPLKKQIQEKAEDLGLRDSIILEGVIENEKMPKIYNESKVFALSSLTEGVPRTVLEALSCGTPVVSTDIPQISGIIDGCGYIVPQKNSEELGDQIGNLIKNEEKKKKFGDKGRKKIQKNYSWRETVEQTVDLYENLVNLN